MRLQNNKTREAENPANLVQPIHPNALDKTHCEVKYAVTAICSSASRTGRQEHELPSKDPFSTPAPGRQKVCKTFKEKALPQKRAQTCENPEKHAKHVQTCKNTRKHAKTHQNASKPQKHVKTWKKRAKTLQKRTKPHQNAQKRDKTEKNVKNHTKTRKNTQKHQKNAKIAFFLGLPRPASACLGLPRPVSACPSACPRPASACPRPALGLPSACLGLIASFCSFCLFPSHFSFLGRFFPFAKLPVTAGGLGLPDLPVLALIARTACIATLPRAEHTDSFRHYLIRQEGDDLLERLRGLSERHPTQMAGDLSDPPPLSLRHLSRKLTKSIQSRAISDLWRRRADLDATLRHQWTRNLPGDAPARPESYHGHGEWLHCLPGKFETTLLDPVF